MCVLDARCAGGDSQQTITNSPCDKVLIPQRIATAEDAMWDRATELIVGIVDML